METVILAAIDRLNYYQDTRSACDENAQALNALQAALNWLKARTADREAREVEGTHEV